MRERRVDGKFTDYPGYSGPDGRCKVWCTSNDNGKVTFEQVTHGSMENRMFFDATPSIQLKMEVVTSAKSRFRVGQMYYLDLTLVTEESEVGL